MLSTSILGTALSGLKICVELVTLLWIFEEDVLRSWCLWLLVVIAVTDVVSLREFEHSIGRDGCDGAKMQVHFCGYS